MKRFTVLFLLIFTFVFAQEVYQSDNSGVSVNGEDFNQQVEEDSVLKQDWINSFFLSKRIFLYPILKAHAEDIGITLDQISVIQNFYKENLPVMVQKAKQIKSYEDELHDLVLHGGEAKRIKELIVEIAKLKAELTAYNVKEVRTIQNTLTTDQYETLLEYLNQND